MGSSFSIVTEGQVANDLAAAIAELDVEESVDMPGACAITLAVNRTCSGDYDVVNDTRLGPNTNLCVTVAATDGITHCIFDGYVLKQHAHLDTGTVNSSVKVHAQDATWLMNMTQQVKEWADVTDNAVASTIFGNYGFTPDSSNETDDSPAHTSDSHTLMQRASDGQFLRNLARRNGKLFRVFCTDTPGKRNGLFARPSLDGAPVVILTLNDANAATVSSVEISWDIMRPSATTGHHALFTDQDPEGAGGTLSDSSLPQMEARGLAAFAGKPVTSILTTPADDGQALTQRTESVLIEAAWFVHCQGSSDANRLGSILRAGTVVRLDAAGSLHSGKYFVWSVHHKITAETHVMNFVLRRNAIGAPPSAGPLPGGVSV